MLFLAFFFLFLINHFFFQRLRDYIQEEHQAKKGTPLDTSDFTVFQPTNIPRQEVIIYLFIENNITFNFFVSFISSSPPFSFFLFFSLFLFFLSSLFSFLSFLFLQNHYDCGVFSSMFADFLSRDADLVFRTKDMPYLRRKMIVELTNASLFGGDE